MPPLLEEHTDGIDEGSGYAAYRTQLFCYLKACGRVELDTWNLWAGMDAPAA